MSTGRIGGRIMRKNAALISFLTEAEIEHNEVLLLDNGMMLFAMCAGRGSGAWFGTSEKLGDFYLFGESNIVAGARIVDVVTIPFSPIDSTSKVVALVVDRAGDTTYLFPSCDDEGNGPGDMVAVITTGTAWKGVVQNLEKTWERLPHRAAEQHGRVTTLFPVK